MNLFDLFAQKAAHQPHHPLIILSDKIYTYSDFLRQTTDYIQQLKQGGIKAGDCIALHYPNSAEYIALTYAIWGCGACVVPIPIELNKHEKQKIFEVIGINAALSQSDIITDIEAIKTSEIHWFAEHTIGLSKIKKYREHPPHFNTINPAFVRFSSGTTGNAKGIILSHETIYERIQAANKTLQLTADDRIVWLLSMAYHFTVSIVAYLTFGCALILCPNTFGITIIRMAKKHQATIIYAAPTHYSLMTHDKSDQQLPNIRMAIVTTTSLSAEVAAAFYKRFKRVLNETYGIIEIGLPCINTSQSLAKQGAVGQLLSAYEIRLLDIDKTSGQGLVQLRGKGMLDAYYDPWKTREDIFQSHQGWFDTGDIGVLDEDGYLWLCGRSKTVINVGGMKFFPEEVEAVLLLHPLIQAACVFRSPNKRLGDEAHAHLVASNKQTLPTVQELNTFCSNHLALHKVPTQFKYVTSLLTTATGKLIRDSEQINAIREQS